MQQLLERLYDELTDTARSTNRIYKIAKKPQNYFTYAWKLKKNLQSFAETKKMSLEQLLKLWIPKWKSEGRLKNGLVELTDQESRLLGLEEAKVVDVNELFCLMMGLFQRI